MRKILTVASVQKAARTHIAIQRAVSMMQTAASPLEMSIVSTAGSVYEFFHSNGLKITRKEWDENTIIPDLATYAGWVYAFYGTGVYVGETKRTFKKRFREDSVRDWWPDWRNVKVLPCPEQTIRKLFESLIGLSGGYTANKAQPAGKDNIFDDILASLLLLNNNNNEPPDFPNQMILDQAEHVKFECSLALERTQQSGN